MNGPDGKLGGVLTLDNGRQYYVTWRETDYDGCYQHYQDVILSSGVVTYLKPGVAPQSGNYIVTDYDGNKIDGPITEANADEGWFHSVAQDADGKHVTCLGDPPCHGCREYGYGAHPRIERTYQLIRIEPAPAVHGLGNGGTQKSRIDALQDTLGLHQAEIYRLRQELEDMRYTVKSLASERS